MFNYLKFLVVLAVTGEHGLKNNIIKKGAGKNSTGQKSSSTSLYF